MQKKKITHNKSNRVKIQRNRGDHFVQTGTTPDYKEVLVLRRFISDRGKVLPQKYSGLTSKFQRLVAKEIKKARFMALLPYTDRHAL